MVKERWIPPQGLDESWRGIMPPQGARALAITLPPLPPLPWDGQGLAGWDYRRGHRIEGAVGAGVNYQKRVKVHQQCILEHVDTVGEFEGTNPVIAEKTPVMADNFNDNSLDPSKWDEVDNDPTSGLNIVTETNQELKVEVKADGAPAWVDSGVVTDVSYDFSAGMRIKVKMKMDNDADEAGGIGHDVDIVICPEKVTSSHMYDRPDWLRFMLYKEGATKRWYLQQRLNGGAVDTMKFEDKTGLNNYHEVEILIDQTAIRVSVNGVAWHVENHIIDFTSAYVYLIGVTNNQASTQTCYFDEFEITGWDTYIRELGNIIYDPGDPTKKYKTFYSGYTLWDHMSIGYAYSPDGKVWTKSPLNPVIPYAGSSASKREDPYVIVVGSTYYIFFERHDTNNIYRMQSTNWTTWTNETLVLSKGAGGEFDDLLIGSPIVWEDNHKVVIPHYDAQLDTAQKRFGTSSLKLDGTNDHIITPHSEDWPKDNNNWTLECYVMFASFPGEGLQATFYNKYYSPPGGNVLWTLRVTGGAHMMNFYADDIGGLRVNISLPFDANLNTYQWYHFEIDRDGDNFHLFCDGDELVGSPVVDNSPIGNFPTHIVIGKYPVSSLTVHGWLDEYRISNNARHTSNFTKPSAPHIADANTVLLLHFDLLPGEVDGSVVMTSEDGQTCYYALYEGMAGGAFADMGLAYADSITSTLQKVYRNYLSTPKVPVFEESLDPEYWDEHELACDEYYKSENGKYYVSYHARNTSQADPARTIKGMGIGMALDLIHWSRTVENKRVTFDGEIVTGSDELVDEFVQSAHWFPNDPRMVLYCSDSIGYTNGYTGGIALGYIDNFESVSISAKCEVDFDDIRLTDSDKETVLYKWLQKKEDGKYAIFHVKVTDDLSNERIIYLYYGKAVAPLQSSGDDTFPFFDDYNDGVIDPAKWSVVGVPVEGGGIMSLDQNDELKGKTNFGFGYACVAKAKADEQDIVFVGWHYDNNNRAQIQNSDLGGVGEFKEDDFNYVRLPYSVKATVVDNYPVCTGQDFRNIWRLYEIKRISASKTIASQDHVSRTRTDPTYIFTQNAPIQFMVWNNSQASQLDIDYCYVRKCVDPEPRSAEWFDEETA